ncbi:PP2C family protein-serine/threonine phosphatase, partial [Nocardioides kribbensis]|uniref:PP2C family protein-serine/threonine phosphatase n=1 Tax=Nocardioides kribbensis TaxID=305517 RepID=UPI0032DB0D16
QGGRATQEDAVLVGTRLVAVADGVGSAGGSGERAVAALAAAERDGLLDRRLDGAAPLGAVEAVLARAAAALAPGDATTLTALALHAGQLVVAHVGDSRAHLVREGRLTRLTRDHTVVQTLVDEGRLTTEEARSDERRVQLNRALEGGRPAEPDLAVHAVRPGDRLVLTTDGVHGRVGPAVLADLLAGGGDPQEVADAVVAAVEAAGADDNLAVVVVDVA